MKFSQKILVLMALNGMLLIFFDSVFQRKIEQ